jgi:hypothetical protein
LEWSSSSLEALSSSHKFPVEQEELPSWEQLSEEADDDDDEESADGEAGLDSSSSSRSPEGTPPRSPAAQAIARFLPR